MQARHLFLDSRFAAFGRAPGMTADPGFPLTWLRRLWPSALELHAGDGFEVAVPDLFLVGLRHVDALDDAQGLTRVHSALLRIEWAVGGEHDLVEVVERNPRMRRRHAAEHCRIRIE